jgi:hypothetical protein
MFRDITKMSSDEITKYLEEVKLEEEKINVEKALNELYEQYKGAKYIYTRPNERYVCFGKIKNIEIRKSSSSKFNNCVDIFFEKLYTIGGTSSDNFNNLTFNEYTNSGSSTLMSNRENKEEIISKEVCDSLVEKFLKIKNSINLNDFTI